MSMCGEQDGGGGGIPGNSSWMPGRDILWDDIVEMGWGEVMEGGGGLIKGGGQFNKTPMLGRTKNEAVMRDP